MGWSRQRHVVVLRRQLDRPLLLVDRAPDRPMLSFADVRCWAARSSRWASHTAIAAIARIPSTNWRTSGVGVVHDAHLKRRRLLAGSVALIFN
jgi:hypothetical protein